MVTDPGGTRRPGEILPLGEPQPIVVRVDAEGNPETVRLRNWKRVGRVLEMWLVEEGWWRQTSIRRTYYQLLLESGDPLIVFHDDSQDAWYAQRYD